MKRNILFLIPTLTGGGSERVIVTLSRLLDRNLFSVSLAVVDTRGAVLRDDVPADVDFFDLKSGRVRYAIPRIIALIRRTRPDVVFSTLGHLNVALAMVRFLLPRNVRTVARESTVISESLRRQPRRAIWKTLYRRFYRKHDEVICQSRYMREDLVRNFGFPEMKSRVINNPVEIDRIRKLASEPASLPRIPIDCVKLVAAGRLDPEKGFDLLIDAISLLRRSDVHVIILGQGPLAAELQNHAARSGVGQQIHFAGFQTNPYAWYARGDAFVLSSHYEGFPNAMLEALVCGTPVIAVPAPGGTREILEGIEGCVMADRIGARELADAIDRWMSGPRKRVEESATDAYGAARILRQYESALSSEALP